MIGETSGLRLYTLSHQLFGRKRKERGNKATRPVLGEACQSLLGERYAPLTLTLKEHNIQFINVPILRAKGRAFD